MVINVACLGKVSCVLTAWARDSFFFFGLIGRAEACASGVFLCLAGWFDWICMLVLCEDMF